MTDEKREIELEHHESNEFRTTHHQPAADVKLHHDKVAPEAIGGLYDEMPKGYYRSKDFIGTLIVCVRTTTFKLVSNEYRRLVSHRSVVTWDGCCQQTLCL